jgi:CDP-glucose 4,6-dehydratase
MTPAFWHGKRVFLTGHTGFKGSWLCLLLHQLGAKVTGYALPPPTQPNLFSLARIGELIDSIEGDVRDLDRLTEALRDAEPDVVMHLAAQSVVLHSYDDPVETYSSNVMGTVNLFEALRRSGRRCAVVNVTTDKCYENRGWVWGYRETDRLGGRDPYSNSKSCAELVAQSFRESFFPLDSLERHGVTIASARAGNVIGGGDWTPRQLIPDAIEAFRGGRPVALRHPAAVRPWQHVLDCLAGYLALAQALVNGGPKFSGEWNFGPADSDAWPVSQVVESLGALWGVAPAWVQDGGTHAPEENRLRLDVSKAASQLGWRSQLPIGEALDWVSHWYRDLHEGGDARALCDAQIARYCAFAGQSEGADQ